MKIFVVLLLLTTALNANAAVVCPANAAAMINHDGTDELIGYLTQLLSERVIGDRELNRMILNLKRGILENPILEEDMISSSSLILQREGIEDHIRASRIDQAKLLTWAEANLKETNQIRGQRGEVRKKTASTHEVMKFNLIEKGSFKMGESYSNRIPIQINAPFEMMSTAVTQLQWYLVMGNNPSRFVDGIDTVTVGEKEIKMRPNNPVETVSWDAISRFLRRLNKLSRDGDPLLDKLIPDHRPKDRYRLPTDFEWEFVARNRGRLGVPYIYREGDESTGQFAWLNEDSTHPVGQLKPLVVDGGEFYDLYGNVWEWTKDRDRFQLARAYLRFPLSYRLGRLFVSMVAIQWPATEKAVRGGSIENHPSRDPVAYRMNAYSDAQWNNLGFRLVRERGP